MAIQDLGLSSVAALFRVQCFMGEFIPCCSLRYAHELYEVTYRKCPALVPKQLEPLIQLSFGLPNLAIGRSSQLLSDISVDFVFLGQRSNHAVR